MQYSQESMYRIMREKFGFESFLPAQERVVSNLLQGKSTLAVMPTGSGKSLCFQLPALMFEGLCVVVSPMISLMQDQVMQIRDLGIPAKSFHSLMSESERQETLKELHSGALKILYVAPETLLKDWFLKELGTLRIDLIAIDEAHCISMWGHDFRPDYRQLTLLTDRFPQAVVCALTATAIPRVQDDICQCLRIANANKIIQSFDRENLLLIVEPKRDSYNRLLRFLAMHPEESGIVYCMTRKRVDTISDRLISDGFRALPYHAGLEDQERYANQEAFIHDKVQIIVATIAFGMGINKSNVRFVIHMDLPKSLETYYQEIGRAGRDGLPSTCLLFYSIGDLIGLKKIIFGNSDSQQNYITQNHLEAMVSYCESTKCRRTRILEYFGETYQKDNCEMCDNCLRDKGSKIDASREAQIFLSAIYRCKENATADEIIKILRGSTAKKILSAGYDKLSVYGIGKTMSTKDWFALYQALRQQYCLVVKDYNKLKLNDKSWKILKAELPFNMSESLISLLVENDENQESGGLFETLRKLRLRLAEERGLPPYVVFSDRSLREMAARYPCDLEGFKTITGVGEYKAQEYGAQFVAEIASFCQEHGLSYIPVRSNDLPQLKPRLKSKSCLVAEYVQAGHSAQETMLRFGIQLSTILDHLQRFIEQDGYLDAGQMQSFYPIEEQAFSEISTAFRQLGMSTLKPVREYLEERYSYTELRLVRLMLLCQIKSKAP